MPYLNELLSQNGLVVDSEDVATGGSAIVHKGHVTIPARWSVPVGASIAVKEYRSEILRMPGQKERIKQEAAVGERISHPNLVRTLGLIESPDDLGEEHWFLIQEWVDGKTLDRWFAEAAKPTSWEAIRSLSNNLLDAVTALHVAKILHRDIKPENVMVAAATGAAILMDVGVAEIAAGDDETLHTSIKDFIGTVRYASPQFIRGEPYTPADDVYGLGATLVLLFTGRPIFDEITRKPLIPAAVLDPNQRRFGKFAPDIPQPLVSVLSACLHHDSSRRPTIEQLRDAINNPGTSAFITAALERERNDARGFAVVQVIPGTDTREFFADIGDAEISYDDVFTVVRRVGPLEIPSLQRTVAPERWIARAIFKHSRQGVGHFRIYHRRLREVSRHQPPAVIKSAMEALGQGQSTTTSEWIEDGEQPERVQVGDIILRWRASTSSES